MTNRRRREPERGRGARVTGLRPCGEARHPHRARRSEPGKPRKSERALPVSCVRNSGSSSPAGRRIWSGNRQGGGDRQYPSPQLCFGLSLASNRPGGTREQKRDLGRRLATSNPSRYPQLSLIHEAKPDFKSLFFVSKRQSLSIIL